MKIHNVSIQIQEKVMAYDQQGTGTEVLRLSVNVETDTRLLLERIAGAINRELATAQTDQIVVSQNLESLGLRVPTLPKMSGIIGEEAK